MFSKRLILPALAVTLLTFYGSCLHAASTAPVQPMQYIYSGYNNLPNSKFEKKRFLDSQKEYYEEKIAKLGTPSKDSEGEKKLGVYREKLREVNECLDYLLEGSFGAGEIIAKGLAGEKNMKVFDDVVVRGVGDGVKKGLQVQLASATGDFAREQIKRVYDDFGAGVVGWFVKKIADLFNDLSSDLFHDGKRPFEVAKLTGWKTIITDAFLNINSMLDVGMGSSLRAMDQTSRQFDEDAASQGGDQQTQVIDAWREFSKIYADQFRYFICHLQEIEEYYEDEDEDDVIIFYTEKICDMLEVIERLLRESKSFKDFNNKISNNKSMIRAMGSYLEKYFGLLIQEVASRSYSFTNNRDKNILPSAGSNNYGMNNYRGGFDSGAGSSFSSAQYY